VEDDSALVAAALTVWLDGFTFVDRDADAVTGLLVDSIVEWGRAQQWRVYRKAPSVLPLPPPYENRRSDLDVACARPVGRPVAIEVDRSDRQRSVEKLRAEAAAGRIALWVRWGTGRFTDPGPPVHLVTCAVTARRGVTGGRVYSRVATTRPAPAHTAAPEAAASPELFQG
jgi:hypothetical protein